jgi:predicted nuclease with TOPRIM domain
MLLSALPSEDGGDGARSRVSKAEVLMLAKRHIVELEREKRMLEGQHHALEGDVEDLKKRFMEMGGACMP